MTGDFVARITGEQLLGVLFTPQQVELQFFSHKFVVYSELSVQSAQGTSVVRQEEPGWRAALCGRMGRVVLWVELEGDDLLIQFDDHAAISIATRRQNLHQPAAIQVWNRNDLIQVY